MSYHAGHSLGPYQLVRQLHANDRHQVWQVVRTDNAQPAAAKLIHPGLATGSDAHTKALHYLRHEAHRLRTLSHPGIVRYHDHNPDTGTLIMEFIQGRSLSELRALPWRTIAYVIHQLAQTLDWLHDQGVIHRDLKPDNVIVTANYRAKLIDFGSTPAASDTPTQAQDEIPGTPNYAAPEVVTHGATSTASDVYALFGVTLFKLLTGQSPYGNTIRHQDILRQHVYQVPQPITNLVAIPPALAQLVMTSLAKNPAQRPTAKKATRLLDQILG